MGKVNVLDESYRKPGRIKILRSLGNDEAIVDSASRLVVIYRLGNIGVPTAAEIYTKVGTCSASASWARTMAERIVSIRLYLCSCCEQSYRCLGS